jgi:hypothetical protein
LIQELEAMDRSQLLTKAFLAASLASAIAVVILCNIAGSGLLARLLVDAFLAGLLTSGIAAALSFRPGAPKALRQVSTAAFGVYASTAAVVVLWVLVAKPPFG